jgi:hypothetical protein
VLDQRGRLLRAALGFAGLQRPSYDRSLWALRTWLDSWAGIGRIAVGMAHQGYLDHLTWSMPSRPPDYFERAGLQIVNTPWPDEAPIEHDGIRGLDLRATGEGTGPTR